jgi:Lon protease-like protein
MRRNVFMKKEQMLEAYKRAEIEWKSLSPKEKAKKIKAHIYALLENEDKDEKTRQELQAQIVMLEEVDSKEIESHLDMINNVIMENCMENIEKEWK